MQKSHLKGELVLLGVAEDGRLGDEIAQELLHEPHRAGELGRLELVVLAVVIATNTTATTTLYATAQGNASTT